MVVQFVLSLPTLVHFGNSTTCLSYCVGSWVLDYGVSDLVGGHASLVSNLSTLKISYIITLSNGSMAQVTTIGQASSLPLLSLNCVIYTWFSL